MIAKALGSAVVAGLLSTIASAQVYKQTDLVSDVPGKAAVTDAHLMGAWGIARSATSPWWVNSTAGGVSLVYNGSGTPYPTGSPLVVTVPPANSTPTGIVVNGTTDFALTAGNPARFIFVTQTGTISGWNSTVNPTSAVIMVNNTGKASYTGAAMAQRNGANLLYVADFGTGMIDVFDGTYKPVTLPSGAFTDPSMPATVVPFNIQWVGTSLYVTYTPKDAFTAKIEAGQGYVDIYDVNGKLLGNLKHGWWMRAPWGVVQAPSTFGKFGGDILVGMFGSGRIAAFGATDGNFHGLLRRRHGKPISVAGKGLWGLEFGNGANAGPADTLYFASDFVVNGNFHGLFGSITSVAASTNGQDDDHDEAAAAPDNDDHSSGQGMDTSSDD